MNCQITHKCKENDAKIKVISNDDSIDELHFQISGEDSWIVIGFKDLEKAISKAKKKLQYDNQGGGYIGEALNSI